jgi:simple sugar transport system ATP-binding protein
VIDTTPLVELRGISKSFGGFRVLHNINLTLRGGETLALVGDNGAGKSTLIKILSGVHQPDAGEIIFSGQRVSFRSPRDARRLGIETVYQDLALIDTLSIARNFFLGAELKRGLWPVRVLNLDEMRQRTTSYLSSIGITRLRSPDELVKMLSGGERQAIAIARAMYFGARLLILDEPTSALSVRETRAVLDYIRQANAKGIAAILISHNVHHFMPVAKEIVVLHQGEVAVKFDREVADISVIEAVIINGREGLSANAGAR